MDPIELESARALSVGQDRTTGDALLHFVDMRGRFVEVRIPAGQVERLAIGAAGLTASWLASPGAP
jgi:hypothetical protein